MPLRIAFDLDGVLADMETALAREAEGLFGQRVTCCVKQALGRADADGDTAVDATNAADETDALACSLNAKSRQIRRLWRHIATIENFWMSLDEMEPRVIARLATVAAERRWEVIFLTRRPETAGTTAQVQTQRWLESKGFPLPSVYVVQGSRGRIAAALGLDILVDDRSENCLDVVVDSRARAILVWRDEKTVPPRAVKRLGIGVVNSVSECLDILTAIAPEAADKPGFIDRVKNMLGIGGEG